MKSLYLHRTLFLGLAAFLCLSSYLQAQGESDLWGDPENPIWKPDGSSKLRDFTNVGYKGGDEPIPNWPVGVNVVTDYGATPNDRGSDVEALKSAIAECPEYHAVFLPDGTYMIDEPIDMSKDNIVIRGESRDGTILYFPKHMNEIRETVTSTESFIVFSGGTNRGIENLSLVLRDEQKGTGYVRPDQDKQTDPHWFYSGERPILFTNGETHSWMRNIYIKNGNHPVRVIKAHNITIMNVVLDDFNGRTSAYDDLEGHMGIEVGDASSNCLVHNILITGDYVHDICVMGVTNSVFSRITGPNVKLDHHALGNDGNLFTEINYGTFARYGESVNNDSETYWGLNGTDNASYLSTSRSCIFVGIKTDEPTSIGDTWHHETIDPNALTPDNLYLAQMALLEKTTIPANMELTLPSTGVEGDPPEPPVTPTGLTAVLDGPKVILDWDTELHSLTYNVYRSTNGGEYKPDAMGLLWSDYENAAVEDGSRYFYRVSAVDAWGQESPQSDVIAATIGGEVSNLPLFRYDSIVEANAKVGVPYTATLADTALNPEPYEMTYSLISTSSSWLSVASDGTLSGTPTADDVGEHEFTVKIEATNGIDTSTLQITVLSASTANLYINESGDGFISDGVNWSTGLPNDSNNIGVINVDCKYNISDRNGYYIIHNAGTIEISGIGSDPVLVGGTFTQNGGTWGTSGNRGFDMNSGNITTLNSGFIYSGSKGHADIKGGSTLIINGGMFQQFGGRNLYIQYSTLTMNGGTLTVGSQINLESGGLLNFNGGTTTASTFSVSTDSAVQFGGTSTGSLTVDSLSINGGVLDWLSDTKMSMTVTDTADWAQALWNADKLTYNGNSSTDLGLDWATVTSTNLGDGCQFAYDSETKTLTLLSDPTLIPPLDTDGDGMSDADETLAGSDPNDARSIFKMIPVTPRSGVTISFQVPVNPGSYYRVFYRDSLSTGDWKILSGYENITPEESPLTIEDTSTADARFYKIAVQANSW